MDFYSPAEATKIIRRETTPDLLRQWDICSQCLRPMSGTVPHGSIRAEAGLCDCPETDQGMKEIIR